jgi:sensor domain CHASE-containing protein
MRCPAAIRSACKSSISEKIRVGRVLAHYDLDEVENTVVGLLAAPIFISSLALITGGSRSEAGAAVPQVTALYRRFADEHAARRRAAGIGSEASPLAAFVGELEA